MSAPAPQAAQRPHNTRLDRLEAQFHDIADRRGYDEASAWWQARWQAYHTSCVVRSPRGPGPGEAPGPEPASVSGR